jgi:hypothetical protein
MMKTAIVTFVALMAGSVSALQSSVEGIENCHNKCDKVFDRLQYAISDQPNTATFEFRSCIIGCNRCQQELQNPNVADDTCFNFCKEFNYGKNGIRKGVIEPDKACLVGCVINTCQEVCFGGTTDFTMTPQNAQFFWGQGAHGCSIKGRLGYVQSPDYGNPDSPVGPGANEAAAQCCTNAFNLCFYNGNKQSTNFANVVLVAQRSCRKFVPSRNADDICTFYNNAQNCGTPGNVPGGVPA